MGIGIFTFYMIVLKRARPGKQDGPYRGGLSRYGLNELLVTILNETSKPPLDIFSYILTYMLNTWLQFTLNMEKSIKQNLSKFHSNKLKLTC